MGAVSAARPRRLTRACPSRTGAFARLPFGAALAGRLLRATAANILAGHARSAPAALRRWFA